MPRQLRGGGRRWTLTRPHRYGGLQRPGQLSGRPDRRLGEPPHVRHGRGRRHWVRSRDARPGWSWALGLAWSGGRIRIGSRPMCTGSYLLSGLMGRAPALGADRTVTGLRLRRSCAVPCHGCGCPWRVGRVRLAPAQEAECEQAAEKQHHLDRVPSRHHAHGARGCGKGSSGGIQDEQRPSLVQAYVDVLASAFSFRRSPTGRAPEHPEQPERSPLWVTERCLHKHQGVAQAPVTDAAPCPVWAGPFARSPPP